MSIHNHPYAPVLLGITNMREDEDMLEALDSEGVTGEDLDKMIDALERCCDVSYRDGVH
jgi:hypothetical protein